ncbi:MAG: PD40 domain-containing protein [Candidatus Marinimicrobia bacterium]|nr:PD40 domain-containing protein [Candidatus Neomarinimicrobiota bacterium]
MIVKKRLTHTKQPARSVRSQSGWALDISLLFLLLVGAGAVQAQFYFGRNKVQYRDFDWQVLRTPHFQLFYYPEEEVLARAAAYWAEEAFGEYEQKFNHTLARRVPLVIYSNDLHFQQTNTIPYLLPEGVAGFFEFIKGRVVIPNNGSLADFRRTVRHELVHVFMHSKINAGGRDAGVWDQRSPPLWFTEGLAEWWAEGWDSQAEMVIRDALLHDHLFPVEQLTLGGHGFLLYKEGQSFLRYMEINYGADRLRRIMEEFYHYDTFAEVIEAVTGETLQDISRAWRLELKQATGESLSRQSLPGRASEALTSRGTNVSPALYHDSSGQTYLVYLSTRDGYTSVYRRQLGTPGEDLVLRGERSPELESLHLMRSSLSISPDGILALVAKSFERDRIRLVDLETLEPVGEFSHPDLTTIRSPSWSPDGRRLVFSAQDQSGGTDLYIWEVGKKELLRLTTDLYLDRDPCFSPDGRAVVFSSDRGRPELDGASNLFILRLSDRRLHVLTHGPHQDRRPRWSRTDSSRIHFVSDRSGTPNIWRLQLGGGGEELSPPVRIQPVTDFHTGAVDFVTLPGDSLLLTLFAGYSFQLHLAAADSSVLVTEAPEAPAAGQSAWRPPAFTGRSGTDVQPYRLKYSMDLAQTAMAYDPTFGLLGGAQVGISDMLGNRYYHFLLANTAQTSSDLASHLNLAVTSVDLTGRVNYSYGFFRFANEYYDPFEEGFYFEKTLGTRVAMNYPLNIFRRVELSASLWQSEKSFFGFNEPRSAYLLSNYISLVHDNSLWQATGPLDGWRARIMAGQTFNLASSQVYNFALLLDNRFYYRFNHNLTFAQRTMVWYTDGTDLRRFYIGGSWGMRGYRFNQIFGRKYIMLNQELRFPFARSLVLNLRSGGVGLAPIRAAFFFDIGNAWEDEFPGLLGSYGFGLRTLFLGALPLRIDFGRRTDFHSVDSRVFTQFFFGWDF